MTKDDLKIGVVVYWNNDVVPFELQPRPFIGKILSIGWNGVSLAKDGNFNTYTDSNVIFYTFEKVLKVGVIVS